MRRYDMSAGNLFTVYFAPRGRDRMYDLGSQIAHLHLNAFDKIIGILGDAGSGKSIFIKGMFPGLELTNDDEGVNVRPLPLLEYDSGGGGFYTPHTYHVDMRFEMGFTQLHELADAVRGAVRDGKRVVVEHFDLLYPALGMNADILIGIGEEIIVTRPTTFGPKPEDVQAVVEKSSIYRRMAHTAEDLCTLSMGPELVEGLTHGDVKRGFALIFPGNKPDIDIPKLEEDVKKLIEADLDVSYFDEGHIMIGDTRYPCTGPRIHVSSTGQIKGFRLLKDLIYDVRRERWVLVGRVGEADDDEDIAGINDIFL